MFDRHLKLPGFTIVELLVSIIVIGLLIAITLFAFGQWRNQTAQREVASDLHSLAAAMENARNFSTGYPATIPTSFTASKNVTVTLRTSTSTAYCAEAVSKAIASIVYRVSNTNKTPVAGTCP